jgi:uncharacterized cupin superfamily protein
MGGNLHRGFESLPLRSHERYRYKNLQDVDDMAPQFGMPAEMPARFAGQPMGLERTGLTHFRRAPGFRIPFGHRHEDQEEVYVVTREAPG